jgi:putative tributyrin esterase
MTLYRRAIPLAIAALFGAVTLVYSGSFRYQGSLQPGTWLRDIRIPYQSDNNNFQATAQIYFPRDYKKGNNNRTLVVLPGYNQSMRVWEQHSGIERYADKYGFVLVCPEMGKTLYETSFYPETSVKWGGIPGGKFVALTLIDYMRNTFDLCNSREKTGIMGLSTGARGAIMLAALYSDRFGATAGLSGDYDPTIMTSDRLLTSIYGDFSKNTERWEREASVLYFADKLKNTSVFLAHGGKDFVVYKEQTIILAIKLKQLHNQEGGYDVVYRLKAYKMHDWSFWGSMVPEITQFFDEKLAR